MNFLRAIKKSIYGPEFYREVAQKPFSSSLIYFLLLSLLLAAIVTPFFSFTLVPKALDIFDKIGPEIRAYYPNELVITIEDGKASTNVEEPYFLPIPEYSDHEINIENTDNLLVIDTNTQFSARQFEEYRTLAWLTKEELITQRDRGTVEVHSLEGVPNVVIDKEFVSSMVSDFLGRFGPIVEVLIFLIPLFTLIGFLFAFIFRLVYLLIGALFIWGVAKLKGVPITYGKAYTLGLHMMTPGLLVSALLLIADTSIGVIDFNIPLLFTATLIVTAWVNLKKEETEEKDKEPNLQTI